jgi:hypothetical protein
MPNIPALSRLACATMAAIGLATAAAAPAQAADTSSSDYKRTCGIVTCSLYYSHDATVRIDDFLRGPADSTDAMAIGGGACAIAGIVAPPTAAVCFALGAVAFGDWNVRRIIHHAATTNGCIRFRTVRGADNSPGPVYSDHSSNCRSLD